MKLNIAGDFVVTDKYQGETLLDESVKNVFEKDAYNLINLEAPIISGNARKKIIKTGPYLSTTQSTILPYLKELNLNAVTLANNHILDYEVEGLKSTISFCKESGIDVVGAGENIDEARRPLRININNKTISIINVAENEWSNAGNSSAGAHPFDIVENSRLIKAEKKDADYVIVIIHGGNEYSSLPSPQIQKNYRFFAEEGADLIVSHHTHSIAGYELYNDVPIYYGLGNFLFTIKSNFECWYSGLVLSIDFVKEGLKCELIPVVQDRETFMTKVITGEKRKILFSNIERLNQLILDETQLRAEWEKYVHRKAGYYINTFNITNHIPSKFIRAILYKTGAGKHIFNTNSLARIINLIRCESHWEITLEVLLKKLEEKSKS